MPSKRKYKVLCVAGARPNFMKIAPLMREFSRNKSCFDVKLVHTGQHYDFRMSDIFFKNLNIPKPDIHLNVGSASHSIQTARIMGAFEKVLIREKPQLIIVVGDVNSTLACSLVASKMNTKVAHVEAGLRSFDNRMPEEINRKVTDLLADFLFVSEKSGLRNLKKEGIASEKIHFVGNIMIDTLLFNLPAIDKSNIIKRLRLRQHSYAVMTLHRPSNVDLKKPLSEIYEILKSIPEDIKIVYPIHPRTRKMIKAHKFMDKFEGLDNLIMIAPLGYTDFIKLVKGSRFIMTDSGGIQEETTVLKIPCLTLRENTERPITIQQGTNRLVGRNRQKIARYINTVLKTKTCKSLRPEYWDGRTAKRVVRILKDRCIY